MKLLLAAALLLSIAANGVLLQRRYHSVEDHPLSPSFSAAAAIISFDENPAGAIAEAWKLSAGTGPKRFTDRLRAAGVPERLVRARVSAAIDEKFRAREIALRPPPKKLKFWQTDDTPLPVQSRLALLDLNREKANLRAEILGPDPAAEADRSYAQLPLAKRELAKIIVEDYGDMLANLRHQQSRGFLLPSEHEQIAFLESQRSRDLAEILCPDEVADLERRNSPIAGRVRRNLKFFVATEAEFQAIFDAESAIIPIKDLLNTGNFSSIALAPEAASEKVAEKTRLQAELKIALGDIRYAEYERAQEYDYPRLADLSIRAGLPPSTTKRAFDLRDQIAADSRRIANDDTLDLDQKSFGLKTLAENARAQLAALLGPDASAALGEYGKSILNISP